MSTTSKSIPAMAWLLCFMTSLFYAYQYILRLLPSVIKDDLMLNYMLDAKDFGYFNGFYYAGSAAFHLPVGLMLDRIGPKYTISLSLFLCGLGIIPPLFSDSWTIAVIGRFLLGGGSVSAILSLFYVIRINFPPTRFASILGISATLGLSGALFGSRPIGILNEMLGWKNVIWILSATAIVLALLFVLFMPNQKDCSAPKTSSMVADLKELLKNKHVWAVSLLAGLMVGSLEGFADAWGVSFLQTVYELNQADAQFIP
ncbi:MAG: MFS transporter, partial [Alphaproteobacteria bacterium]|nr:MFS transporter [Alphaproteobacteria bacterium]